MPNKLPTLEQYRDPFRTEVARLLGIEGDYADHPADRGGRTRYGITEAVARSMGYAGRMDELPLPFALYVYHTRYWQRIDGDAIHNYSADVAREVFDTAVLMGPERAVRYLQRGLNLFNHCGKHYAELAVDGIMGAHTESALHAYMMHRRNQGGTRVLLAAMNTMQGHDLIDLADADPTQEAFTFGWFKERIVQSRDY